MWLSWCFTCIKTPSLNGGLKQQPFLFFVTLKLEHGKWVQLVPFLCGVGWGHTWLHWAGNSARAQTSKIHPYVWCLGRAGRNGWDWLERGSNPRKQGERGLEEGWELAGQGWATTSPETKAKFAFSLSQDNWTINRDFPQEIIGQWGARSKGNYNLSI